MLKAGVSLYVMYLTCGSRSSHQTSNWDGWTSGWSVELKKRLVSFGSPGTKLEQLMRGVWQPTKTLWSIIPLVSQWLPRHLCIKFGYSQGQERHGRWLSQSCMGSKTLAHKKYAHEPLSLEQCLTNKRLPNNLKNFSYLWSLLWGVVLWCIWIERNDLVFNGIRWHNSKLERII